MSMILPGPRPGINKCSLFYKNKLLDSLVKHLLSSKLFSPTAVGTNLMMRNLVRMLQRLFGNSSRMLYPPIKCRLHSTWSR